jgi:hypothetical protein
MPPTTLSGNHDKRSRHEADADATGNEGSQDQHNSEVHDR